MMQAYKLEGGGQWWWGGVVLSPIGKLSGAVRGRDPEPVARRGPGPASCRLSDTG